MSGSGDGGPKILLVEDNETIRGAFAILLEESGYGVLQAGTGGEAAGLAERERPDLILMDLGLPDMSGLEVTRRLKQQPATQRIPIVALTGRTLEADVEACLAAGCDGYLTKPIDSHQLLERIQGFLRGAGG